MSYYLVNTGGATINLGNINKESHKQTSSLDVFNFPASGTSEAQAFDYGDTQRRISLSGTYTATSLETIANWISSMNALQNGDQSDAIIFHSDLWDAITTAGASYTNGEFLVKVEDFNFDYQGAKPLVVNYSISLVESS